MIEFIDETSLKNGTPINRKNMMGIQGFFEKSVVFLENGVEETNEKGEILRIEKLNDNEFLTTFVGEKTIKKRTIFKADGSVEVVIE